MQRPDWFNETLFPFESKFMEVDGSTIHYVDQGTGPAIVMAHGNPAWSFLYRKIISGLQDRFRCIAVDSPGFGLSKAAPGYGYMPHEHSAVLGQVVDNLGLDEFSVMANDWGGPIGFGMAVERPSRVHSLIVCNTWAWPITGDRRAEWFSKSMGSSVMGLAITRLNFFVNVIMKTSFRRSKPSKEEWAMYQGPFPTPESREPIAVLPGAILGETPWLQEISEKLEVLSDRPALILWPDKDPAFRSAQRERWERLLPRHHTVIIEGAGHYVQDDAGEQLVDEIRKWWPGV